MWQQQVDGLGDALAAERERIAVLLDRCAALELAATAAREQGRAEERADTLALLKEDVPNAYLVDRHAGDRVRLAMYRIERGDHVGVAVSANARRDSGGE
jgi:hypothetical protein